MHRSLGLVLAGVCLALLFGCRGPELKKQIASLESRLQTCAEQRDGLRRELAQLESEHLVQGESLKAAQEELARLSAVRTALERAKQEREQQVEELTALVKKVSGMHLESRPEGDFIVIENEILFAPGKIDLSDEARRTLDQTVVAYLKDHLVEYPDQQVRIDGHTDGVPITHSDWLSNWHLASMRAHAVMQYLVSRGIPAKNMYIVGFGPNRPRVLPPTPDADVPENRRVEILIVPRAAAGIDEVLQKFRE